MNTSHKAMLALLAAAAVALIGWRAFAWHDAASDFDDAYAQHAAVAAKAGRVTALRALPPVTGYGSRPTDDVIQLTSRVLETANLPAARLRGVQPEADRAVTDDRGGGGGDNRRLAAARLGLEPLTVQELGAFLSSWRSSQQVWSIARVDLNALPLSGPSRTAGQYRASITVTASYIDDPAPTVPAAPAPTAAKPTPSGPLVHPTPNGARQ